MISPFYQQTHPRFTGQNLEQNKKFYTRIEALCKKHGCTPIQLALAWVFHQGDDVAAIPGEQLFVILLNP